jgi:hypothetical protein
MSRAIDPVHSAIEGEGGAPVLLLKTEEQSSSANYDRAAAAKNRELSNYFVLASRLLGSTLQDSNRRESISDTIGFCMSRISL